MSILAAYQNAIDHQHIMPDDTQHQVVRQLETIYQQLTTSQSSSVLSKWFRSKKKIKGLYMWGGVGIGKTYLLDLFYRTLPFELKLRAHFHEFIRDIHHQLTQYQGVKDPLKKIAADIAKHYIVLCFDEFFVNDIGDAMILGNLLNALFERGVTVVTTSNVEPDKLYWHGLQRELFLPAIKAIKQNMHVLHLAIQQDYREIVANQTSHYYFPMTDFVRNKMQAIFVRLANGIHNTHPIQINQRLIKTIAWAEKVIWFDFNDLCHVPRSQNDYLEIAQQFETVMVSQVPQIKANQDHLITYFIHLIDILYDKGTKLFIAADVSIEELYPFGRKVFEFQRTQSRLVEMTLG